MLRGCIHRPTASGYRPVKRTPPTAWRNRFACALLPQTKAAATMPRFEECSNGFVAHRPARPHELASRRDGLSEHSRTGGHPLNSATMKASAAASDRHPLVPEGGGFYGRTWIRDWSQIVMTNVQLRQRLADLIDDVVAERKLPAATLDEAESWVSADWSDNDAKEAHHALLHYREDEDIRSKDSDYRRKQQAWLAGFSQRLRGKPASTKR